MSGYAIYQIKDGERRLWGYADTRNRAKFAEKLAYAATLFGHIEVEKESAVEQHAREAQP